ncbi:MAG: nucleoside phosphorylase [Chloroflexi bacterium]|nr:nucleoside phosphorylase [Chloroflexota bacterium]
MQGAVPLEGSEFEEVQPHILCRKGDVARYVFVPGDLTRARRIAEHFQNARKVAENREYVVYTGEVDGVQMSVCSTGIGSPSAAIAVEELGKIGADTFIRVGSAGGMQENVNPGDIVVVTAAYRGEGTSRQYLPPEFPAMADRTVTDALVRAARRLGYPVHIGLGSSGDAFYAKKPEGHLELLHQAGVLAGEMECSAVFVVATLRRWRAGAIVAIDGNVIRRERKTPATEPLFRQAEEREIQIAIEAVKILAEEGS